MVAVATAMLPRWAEGRKRPDAEGMGKGESNIIKAFTRRFVLDA